MSDIMSPTIVETHKVTKNDPDAKFSSITTIVANPNIRFTAINIIIKAIRFSFMSIYYALINKNTSNTSRPKKIDSHAIMCIVAPKMQYAKNPNASITQQKIKTGISRMRTIAAKASPSTSSRKPPIVYKKKYN